MIILELGPKIHGRFWLSIYNFLIMMYLNRDSQGKNSSWFALQMFAAACLSSPKTPAGFERQKLAVYNRPSLVPLCLKMWQCFGPCLHVSTGCFFWQTCGLTSSTQEERVSIQHDDFVS